MEVEMNWWLAHILAVHLNVPEPVTIEIRELWPQSRCAQIVMVGEWAAPQAWRIQYDSECWKKKPSVRAYVIAHESCHAVYRDTAWDKLSKAEQKVRHKRVSRCAERVMRDHKEER